MLRLTAVLSMLWTLTMVPACWSGADAGEAGPEGAAVAANRSLLIVVDGLRPDYITPEFMPNLYSLGTRGIFGEAHSAAFPTLTAVNTASISTGSYPARHGIVHNTMWGPELGTFSALGAEDLWRLEEISGEGMLTAPSVGEFLEETGRALFVVGSAGPGNTLIQNPHGSGKGSWSARDFFLPASARQQAIEAVGELPSIRSEKTAWAVDAYLLHALGDAPPDLTIIWITDADQAGHAHGVGSPEVIEALAGVDRQIGRIEQEHTAHGLSDRINIFVTADHGFTTNAGDFDLSRLLEDAFLATEDVMVVGDNMIHLRDPSRLLLEGIVEALQRDHGVGSIYTRPASPGSLEGLVSGTVSTAVVRWDHPRSAEILVTPTWNDEPSSFGFPGSTSRSGVATHGSDSPYDVRIRLVAAGPDLKRGVRSRVPTGNVDLVPTILHLQGITPLDGMDGRVLHELLRDGPTPESVDVRDYVHHAAHTFPDGFRYEMWVETATVGSTTYLRGARTERGH